MSTDLPYWGWFKGEECFSVDPINYENMKYYSLLCIFLYVKTHLKKSISRGEGWGGALSVNLVSFV